MKPSGRIVFGVLACALFCIGVAAAAQDPGAPLAAAAPPISSPLTVILLGTRYPQDVDIIRQHLLEHPSVLRFVPSAASQGRLEFSGAFTGDADALLAEIRGLAVDRYELTATNDAARGLVLTLRKMRDDPHP